MRRKKATALIEVITEAERRKRGQELDKLEAEIRQLESQTFEEFYGIGKRLERVRAGMLYVGKKDKDGEYFTSWAGYCASGRTGYAKAYADRLIVAADYREVLPALPAPSNGGDALPPTGGIWTEWTVRPLTRLPMKSDARRVAKKVLAEVNKNGAPLTATLVKRFVDEDLGVPRQKARRQKAKFDAAKPDKSLQMLLDFTIEHRVALENVDEDFWEAAEKASPGIVKRLTTELDRLVAYLRS